MSSVATRKKAVAETAAVGKMPCPRCHKLARISTKAPVCAPCRDVIEGEAQVQQERAYLCAWLSTRADDTSRTARRLRALAQQQGLDWIHPPRPMLFAERLAALLAPYRATPGGKAA